MQKNNTTCYSLITDTICPLYQATTSIFYHVPACVEEMGAPSVPREAGPADSPMVVAGQTSSRKGDLDLVHPDHSRALLLWVDLRSSSLVPSDRSTFPRGCSMEDKEEGAGLGQTEAGKGHRCTSEWRVNGTGINGTSVLVERKHCLLVDVID